MQDASLEDIMSEEFWIKNQTELLVCIDFCKKYYPLILKIAGQEKAKVMVYQTEGCHAWLELLNDNKRFIIDAAIPKKNSSAPFLKCVINYFYVGYLDDCTDFYLKRYYDNAEHSLLAELIEEQSIAAYSSE